MYVSECDEPSLLPVGAYLLVARRWVASSSGGHMWPTRDVEFVVVADGYQQAAERAAEWCADGEWDGDLYLITGDDSSRRIATIDGASWRLL